MRANHKKKIQLKIDRMESEEELSISPVASKCAKSFSIMEKNICIVETWPTVLWSQFTSIERNHYLNLIDLFNSIFPPPKFVLNCH